MDSRKAHNVRFAVRVLGKKYLKEHQQLPNLCVIIVTQIVSPVKMTAKSKDLKHKEMAQASVKRHIAVVSPEKEVRKKER